jgi:hypothetical protein
MVPSKLEGFWPISRMWCHILPTRLTLHPANSNSEENSSRVAGSPKHATRKWLLRMPQKLAAPLRLLSSLRRGLLLRWCQPPKSSFQKIVTPRSIYELMLRGLIFQLINFPKLRIVLEIFVTIETLCNCWLKYCYNNYHSRIVHLDISCASVGK